MMALIESTTEILTTIFGLIGFVLYLAVLGIGIILCWDSFEDKPWKNLLYTGAMFIWPLCLVVLLIVFTIMGALHPVEYEEDL